MSNPAFSNSAMDRAYEYGSQQDVMTVNGTTTKSGILLMLCGATAVVTWTQVVQGQMAQAMPLIIGGGIIGFILALVTMFKPTWSPISAPLYAVAEGLFLGGISAMYNMQFQGIVIQAICLTFGTMFTMLLLYRSGLVQVTQKFRTGVMAATGAIFFVYILSFALSFFGVNIPFIHTGGTFGICFSIFVIIIAALNLILDFDFIDRAAHHGSPKFMEWYAAFGLMVTLVWLYLEILRLLSYLQGDD